MDCNKKTKDGSESLVKGFGGDEQFVKKVIEDCIFFDPDLIKKRFNDIILNLNLLDSDDKQFINKFLLEYSDGSFLPVRSSKDLQKINIDFNFEGKDKIRKFTFKSSLDGKNKKCLVNIDKEGNSAVRKLIKEMTCCVIKEDITHYVISHIWKQAGDPRFFSNLWNILLVPSYANPFLEKNYEKVLGKNDEKDKSLMHAGAMLLNTVKAVMYNFYKFEDLDWNELLMNCPSFDNNAVIPNDYNISYLQYKPFDSAESFNNSEFKTFVINKTEIINLNNNIMENMNTEYEEEIQKVRRRVPGWKRKPDQVNSKILGLFMELSDNGKKGIFVDMLEDEFGTKYPEEISLFVRNYNQMKNISEKNHGKVFDEDEEKTVWLWEPVKDFIIETYSH